MSDVGLGLGRADHAFAAPAQERGASRRRGTHAAIPLASSETARFLVPLSPTVSSARAIRGYKVSSSALSRLSAAVVSGAFRLGAASALPRRVTLGGPGTFVEHVLQRFPSGGAFSVHLGPPRANRKPVMHIMDRTGTSLAYVKLGVNALTCARVRAETASLSELSSRRLQGVVVPEVIDSGTWDDLDYLIMSPVHDGPPAEPSLTRRRRASESLVGAFPSYDSSVADAPWWTNALSSLETKRGDSDAERLMSAAARLQDKFGRVTLRHGACHGDWTPWNMAARDDDAIAVWDWERFAENRPAGWDALHFHVASYRGDAATGLRSARRHLAEIITGVSHPHEREAILATYLLHRGCTFLADRQEAAGAPNGPLGRWLLPAIEELV